MEPDWLVIPTIQDNYELIVHPKIKKVIPIPRPIHRPPTKPPTFKLGSPAIVNKQPNSSK